MSKREETGGVPSKFTSNEEKTRASSNGRGLLREDMVRNGMNFWQHPQVQSTSVEQRVRFLVGKGLTREEIDEVRQRCGDNNATPVTSTTSTETDRTSSTPDGGETRRAAPQTTGESSWIQKLTYGGSVLAAGAALSQLVTPSKTARDWWSWTVSSGNEEGSSAGKEESAGPGTSARSPRDDWRDLVDSTRDDHEADSWHRSAMRRQRSVGESLEIKGLRTEIERLQRSIERQESNMKQMEENLRSMQRRQEESARANQISAELASIKTLLVTRQVEHNIRSTSTSIEVSPSPFETPMSTSMSPRGRRQEETSSTTALRSIDQTNSNRRLQTNVMDHQTPVMSKAVKPDIPSVPDTLRPDLDELVRSVEMLCAENEQESLDRAKPFFKLYVSNLIKMPDIPRYRRISTSNAGFKNQVAKLRSHEKVLAALGFQMRGIYWEYRPNGTEEDFKKFVPLLEAGLALIDNATFSSVLPSKPPTPPPFTPQSLQPLSSPSSPSVAITASAKETKDDTKQSSEKVDVSPSTAPPETLAQVYKMLQSGEKLPGVRDIPDKLSEDPPSSSEGVKTKRKPWEAEDDLPAENGDNQ